MPGPERRAGCIFRGIPTDCHKPACLNTVGAEQFRPAFLRVSGFLVRLQDEPLDPRSRLVVQQRRLRAQLHQQRLRFGRPLA
jgi:hypothetical protein